MASSRFMGLVNRLPVSWESALASGLDFLAEELEAETMKFKVHDNGVSIQIVCDETNQRKAAQFWKDEVKPKLGD